MQKRAKLLAILTVVAIFAVLIVAYCMHWLQFPSDTTANDYSVFTKSGDNAYYRGVVIPGVEVSTFSALNDPQGRPTLYSKDSKHVYVSDPQSRETRVLENADPVSFRVLVSLTVSCVPDRQRCDGDFPFSVILAKDANAVYGSMGGKIKNADAPSFENLKTPIGSLSVYSKDKNNIYSGSINAGDAGIINVDRDSFQVLSETEAHDKNHFYFEGGVVSE